MSLFNEVDASGLETAAGRTIGETADLIGDTLTTLPEGVVIVRLHINHYAVTISGLSPAQAGGAQTATAGITAHPGDYPGFNRFELMTPLEAAP